MWLPAKVKASIIWMLLNIYINIYLHECKYLLCDFNFIAELKPFVDVSPRTRAADSRIGVPMEAWPVPPQLQFATAGTKALDTVVSEADVDEHRVTPTPPLRTPRTTINSNLQS